MLNFSTENSSKHQVGIQKSGLCEGRDRNNCVFADKCIRNDNGIWYCPPNKSRSRGGIKLPAGFDNLKK